jgi:hypothetical protein
VVGRLLGRSVESSYLLTGFEPDRGFEGTMTSPVFGFSERYRFESAGDGTCVSMSATVEPRGLFRLLGPVLAAGARRQVRADHRHLKTVLERPTPVADPGR